MGRNLGSKNKAGMWRAALRRRLRERGNFDQVADAVINAALAGDMIAAKEIGDRLDGKAIAYVESTSRVTIESALARVLDHIEHGRIPTGDAATEQDEPSPIRH